MLKLIEVKDKEEYFRKLNVGISMSKMWNSLQTKSEVGLGKSEIGYQMVSKVMAGNIARGLGLNADLAECLAMCQGVFFPAYGKEGKKVVLQFMEENGMEMSEADLGRNFVIYDLHRTHNIISTDFDQKLHELFASNSMAKTPEVELARFCGKIIDEIKEIEMNTNVTQADYMYKTVKEIVNECIESGKLVQNENLIKSLKEITKIEYTLSDKQRDEIYNRIMSLSKIYKSEKMAGIYEFIGASERCNV
ncbi:MAG: hypothetical protein PHH04_07620 [Thomasclavelia sp.]|nr:hypothetical protein [Thomasclavelia sp.]